MERYSTGHFATLSMPMLRAQHDPFYPQVKRAPGECLRLSDYVVLSKSVSHTQGSYKRYDFLKEHKAALLALSALMEQET